MTHRPRDIEEVVADMRPMEAVNYLLEAYRNLSGESPARELQLAGDFGFRPSAAKIYAVLEASLGQVVSHPRLELILVQSGYEGGDMRNRLHLEICALRRRMAEKQIPLRIETIPCVGYRLVPASSL